MALRKGFVLDVFWRVGEGTTGVSSSSSSSEFIRVGCQRASASAALSKILLPLTGALVPPLRLGERDRDAMDIGDGSDISTSIGVPGATGVCPAKVCARAKPALALFFKA